MAQVAVNTGDSWGKKPKPSRPSTGNHAPRVQWPFAIKMVILLAAHHLGYTDDEMAAAQRLPSSSALAELVLATMPLLQDWYNSEQQRLLAETGYRGRTTPFENGKIRHRLEMMFKKPGRARRTRPHNGASDRPVSTLYGISPEHPKHTAQNTKGRQVWAHHSVDVSRRLIAREEVSRTEVLEWSRVCAPKSSDRELRSLLEGEAL